MDTPRTVTGTRTASCGLPSRGLGQDIRAADRLLHTTDAPDSLTARWRHPTGALRDLHIRADRGLSQSFLAQPAVADAMVRAADLDSAARVLEIGPGLGVLTARLVQLAALVVAVELDRALANALPASLGSPPNLRVIHGDALSVNLGELIDEPYIVVASLPYHVASPILFKLAFHQPRPTRIVAMLQREVAHRIVPRAGSLTYLGAAFATVAQARIVRPVAAGSFFPVPRVRSAIVRLDLQIRPTVPVDSVDAFVEFLRAGFAQPRKQLHNSLARGLGVPASVGETAALQAGIGPSRRPGTLSLDEWARLYEQLRWLPRPQSATEPA